MKSGLKSPRSVEDMVFHASSFSPSDLKKVMGAIRCKYDYIGSRRKGVIHVTPDVGHEKAVCTLLTRLFGHPDYLREERQAFIAKYGKNLT